MNLLAFKTSILLIWLNVLAASGFSYLWKEALCEMRLYMPDEQNKMTWRSEELVNSIRLFNDPWYDPRKPTLIIAHGWFQSAQDEIIVILLKSMFNVKFYEKMNIIVLNTPYFLDSIISNVAYYYPAKNIEKVGELVGNILNKTIEQGLIKADDINLLGLSLGAHLSGYIGRAVSHQIQSIVGLDPAGPGFDGTFQYWTKFQHVSKLDAKFVHLYHTNSVSFGTTQRVGTADFEFNEGISQPGCATSLDPKCSHKRAFYIFNDIIQGDDKLIALHCDTEGSLKGSLKVMLQYPIDTSAEGLYYLKTASTAPFGLGEEGLKCWKVQEHSLEKENETKESKTLSIIVEMAERFKSNMAYLHTTYLTSLH